MTVHYKDDSVTVHHGDCLAVLRELPDASVDSVVTDPPYGLANTTPELVAETIAAWLDGDRGYMPDGKGFMGRRWDAFVPPVAVWDECRRVLKPGGHLLTFAGSRTLDLMTLAVRLAGLEVRDTLAWVYGSGFPKSRDVSESMERYLSGAGPELAPGRAPDPDIYKVTAYVREARDAAGWTNRQIDALFGTNGMAGHWVSRGSQPAVPSLRQWAILKEKLGMGDDVDELVERFAATERPDDWGTRAGDSSFLESLRKGEGYESAGGWGTALKPALEPIVFARKPAVGSTTANVAAFGTGALNIDGCRVPAGEDEPGRWPTNLLLDGYAAAELDRQAPGERPARFFPTFRYEAKAPTSERPVVNGVAHPTVKPLELMRWLVRLVTPPGGVILEPFAGSGTTVEAAVLEGFECIAVEREAEYLPLIEARLRKPLTPALDLAGLGGGGGLW